MPEDTAVPIQATEEYSGYRSDLKSCYAVTCRFNESGACSFHSLSIGIEGQCLGYEKLTRENLKAKLQAQGLEDEIIELVLRRVDECRD